MNIPGSGPRVAFITAVAPTGPAESFVLAELAYLRQVGLPLTIAPVRLEGAIFHEQGKRLAADSLLLPLVDLQALIALVGTAVVHPLLFGDAVWTMLRRSGSVRATLKNLASLPKACRLAGLLRRQGVTHVHGSWASVPATVAWLLARLLGVPWSFTAIRWDVDEANLLGPKISEAAFVRATSEGAKQELLRRSGLGPEYGGRILVIPHGVLMEAPVQASSAVRDRFRVLSVGFLVPKKGHRFLIEACRILQGRGIRIDCSILGSGPLQHELERQIAESGLQETVHLGPFVPQAQLLARLGDGSTDLLVYPSIVAEDGQREGIPVTLVETLALGVPVLSTPTGDITELLGTIPAALVAPGDAEALADRLERLHRDRSELASISREGRAVVVARFSMSANIGGTLRSLLTEETQGRALTETGVGRIVERRVS